MTFVWDPVKAAANVRKHGIRFPDAIGALEDMFAVTRPADHVGEARFATLGTDLLGRVIVVIWTDRGDVLRLISARRATPRERRYYQER